MSKISVVLSGVGGQGVITAANILGKAAVNAKTKVYASEVHGMAQRGGSVFCTVRMGEVSSPLVASGTADVMVSLEPVEALRYIRFANKNTKLVTDITPVVPFTVSVGNDTYPALTDIFKELDTKADLYKINALDISKKAGATITKNIVMLGALAATEILPFDTDVLLKTILANVPEKFKTINNNAFKGGIEAINAIKK
jgi:indolepyruvate ferredoxin oxidoreductase, beta subunit